MTEDQINQTLDKVAGTLLEEPVQFVVKINPSGRWQKFLIRKGWISSERHCEIPPLCLGARAMISHELRKIPVFKNKGIIEINHTLSDDHTRDLARVIAMAMRNQRTRPSSREIDFVLQNITAGDQKQLFSIIIQQLNISDFVSSTALIKGAGLLEKPEIIAGTENVEKANTSIPGQSPAA